MVRAVAWLQIGHGSTRPNSRPNQRHQPRQLLTLTHEVADESIHAPADQTQRAVQSS